MSLTRKQSLKVAGSVSGFTLVELMVSVLVLAIGLLGLASLQVTGLGSNHNAYLRTQATLLAQDMADRMRANPAGLATYLVAGAISSCGTSCTPQQMAKNDHGLWDQSLAAQLPGGSGAITSPAIGIYNIRVTWVERADNPNKTSANIQQNFDMSFQP